MKWTSEKPTKLGWYWHRPGEGKTPTTIRVLVFGGALRAETGGYFERVEYLTGQWAGPLEEPQE